MDSLNVVQKLIKSHLVKGEMIAGSEIGLKIDQALLQDATGTLVQLELEAMRVKKAMTEVAVQYIDHNLLQTDFKNADDHLFLQSAAAKFGIWFSRPGNGVSHPVHQQHFGKPGKTLIGSDSHTPAAGALGMLALGSGGLDVAFAIAGEPLYIDMPKVFGVRLTGKLSDWVSAKDVVLEMLRRYDVNGCRGMIIEYHGEGLSMLSTMDRHVIANMGTEMGATSTVFPSDDETRRYLKIQGREKDWVELKADNECIYDFEDEIDLSKVEPLIACPSSPGNVIPVKEIEGKEVHQCVIGSSANPGVRDFWVVAEIVRGRKVHDRVSLDVNPSSRQMLENLTSMGSFKNLVHAGARSHQTGCMGCIGMGQAPATNTVSLRTMPRNFPGRSGTLDDQVYLCSPETAAASALTGAITDPRNLEKIYGMNYPKFQQPETEIINTDLLIAPIEDGSKVKLRKGPNIKELPYLEPLKDTYNVPVVIKVADNISTDEILRAGAEVLPLRSNIPEISKWTYFILDEKYYDRALEAKNKNGGHITIAGENYAQGSSREHAALAPRYLGQVAVVAKSYARIGWQNLANFGILPLEFENPEDYDKINQEDDLVLENLHESLKRNLAIVLKNKTSGNDIKVKHNLSERQADIVIQGGVINHFNICNGGKIC
ncbi:aconitate hydratase [Nitrosomonas aestuarii]|uniref:aconitate hydratase n=1 Tax=Nitrosomonas aestuarii TaxID=52441 RepID=UPI000D310679|nr:aconitate hydratase [Nitrosomonas aestuarii]PTN09665.1 aconitase [Nitrosomonas aestuarii]